MRVAVVDLTTEQQTEVINFITDNSPLNLPSFGDVPLFRNPSAFPSTGDNADPTYTLQLPTTCTDVQTTPIFDEPDSFPEAEYAEAFNNALASVATAPVTTSVRLFQSGPSSNCDDPTQTLVNIRIEVAEADLGAVLELLPIASGTINLGTSGGIDFGVVSLGNILAPFNPAFG